ncbi:FMN-dependent NADH-azoreductase, partial [Methylophaga sp. UBA3996]
NEDWIHANFTDPEQRTEQNKQALKTSDQLVEELQAAEILVIASPIYNFSVPAVLKAWIDQVARARVTFRYTENGPEGLLKAKKAYLVMASGGVPLGSEVDYASTYLNQVMNFLGIHDVTVVDAGSLIQDTETLTQKVADLVS